MGKRKWAEPGRAEDKKGFGEYSLSVDIDFYSAKISKADCVNEERSMNIFKKQLDEFNHDPEVKKLVGADSIFDILSLKETGCSSILAWLTDARESHGLGNAFVVELLKKISGKDGRISFCRPGQKSGKSVRWDQNLFRNSIVFREYVVKDGRIDILAMDYERNLCLVIENKYGSKVHDHQLQNYRRDLFGLCQETPEMSFVFVYLDPADVRGAATEFDGWKVLNYDFVVNFIDEYADKCLFANLLKAFKNDIINFDVVFYFQNVIKIANRHSDIVRKLSRGFATLAEYLKLSDRERYLNAVYTNNDYFIEDAKFYLNNREIFDLYFSKTFQSLFRDNDMVLGRKTVFNKAVIDFTTRKISKSALIWFAYGKIRYEKNRFVVKVEVEKKYFKGPEEKYARINNIDRKITANDLLPAIREAENILRKISAVF